MGKIRGEIGGEVHGTVGDVTISTWKGMKVAKRKRGPSTLQATEGQQRQREQFVFASEYDRDCGWFGKLTTGFGMRISDCGL